MSMAFKITGRAGNQQHICDTYEPLQIKHNGKAAWVARSVAPRYLFHSGKARWVISKQLDDGAHCYAYVRDPGGADPSGCPGPWQIPGQGGAWGPEPSIRCQAAPASNDKFVQLRMSLEADMRQYGLIEVSDVKKLWKRLDYNGNDVVSLAEIDKMVVELVKGGTWPQWLDNKPALMRAYKKTILKDGDGDDWVEKKEFHALLLNIFWFNKLFLVFGSIDTGADRRIDLGEFQRGLSQLGLNLSGPEAQQEFQKIDGNRGGQVLFVEFCAYIRTRVNPDAQANFDADVVSGEACGKSLRAHMGHDATRDFVIQKKSMKDFDDLEKKIKALMQDNKKLHELWNRIDFNGNNIVSLAEIDKLVVENYPALNHKPALMRAYKRTIKGGDGDDWVDKKEFKSLLGNLFYFNKIYWIFDNIDGDDRRLTLQEFKLGISTLGLQMTESEARREFQAIDRNGGGMVLFDEFCRWFTTKKCPESLQDMVASF